MLLLAVPWQVNTSSNEKNFSVSLLQGNIPQDLKYTKLREQAVEWYVDQAIQAETDLVVMPETAIPYLRKDIPNEGWQKISTHFSAGQKALIIGIPTFEKDKGIGNSAIALQANAEEYLYNKQHLVPFGEFIPTYFQWFNKMVNFGITDFIRGPLKPKPFVWNGQNIAIQICYEDLFGEELAQRFMVQKENMPSLLVNMSNIAWFGNTVVIPQHLHIARMRSIELNRPACIAWSTYQSTACFLSLVYFNSCGILPCSKLTEKFFSFELVLTCHGTASNNNTAMEIPRFFITFLPCFRFERLEAMHADI
ncbi:MAG: apolipoprotein N-acyltransferase [Betaproteobacteria bacterium]|nr:apolipoprotein N-acyltransferase [Betaproteobacteria bacterium]